jgi:hypothetical protein
MRFVKFSLRLTAGILWFFLIACATTKFPSVWKDEAYQGHPEKILVINTFPDQTNRKTFEDEFVKALKDRGVNGVVSYTVMPEPAVSDKDAIAVRAKEADADAVLINRLLHSRIGQSAGTDYMELYMSTQTDVYDMKSNRLILSVTAETVRSQSKPLSDQIQSYVNDLVDKLSGMGLF